MKNLSCNYIDFELIRKENKCNNLKKTEYQTSINYKKRQKDGL